MVSALTYTQQKEKCVCHGACVVIYTTKGGVCVCTQVHVLSYTQQKD